MAEIRIELQLSTEDYQRLINAVDVQEATAMKEWGKAAKGTLNKDMWFKEADALADIAVSLRIQRALSIKKQQRTHTTLCANCGGSKNLPHLDAQDCEG